jgi:hypothetical protein
MKGRGSRGGKVSRTRFELDFLRREAQMSQKGLGLMAVGLLTTFVLFCGVAMGVVEQDGRLQWWCLLSLSFVNIRSSYHYLNH